MKRRLYIQIVRWTGFSLSILLTGCNFFEQKVSPDTSLSTKTISWNRVMMDVLSQRCVSCHGNKGGVNLQTCDNVVANAQKVYEEAIVKHDMPPDGPLSQYQQQVLMTWFEAGAPEKAGGPPEMQPILPPSPAPPLLPTYDSIRDQIFTNHCVKCHNPTGPGKKVNLMSYEALVTNDTEQWVVPANPDLSGLYQDITTTSPGNPPDDNARMPPFSSGAALSADQIAVIRTWIANGAPESDVSPTPSASPTPSPSPSASISPTPSPTPVPSPTGPLVATYASIRDQIFANRCVKCHNPKGHAKKVNLMDYDALVTNDTEQWVVPGKPELSGLYQDITATSPGNPPDDGARMPPFSTGPGLSADQIQAIQTWIQNGAGND